MSISTFALGFTLLQQKTHRTENLVEKKNHEKKSFYWIIKASSKVA